jgi:hypothetical protein
MRFKPFNQAMHDKCDPPARDAVMKYLRQVWCVDVIPNPNKFEVDLVAFKDWMPHCYIEVEHRMWRQGWHYCPYDTIHVPYRKQKLFNNELPTYMFAVNYLLKYAYWIDVETIKESPVMEVQNTAVATDEYFYDVPVSKWRLVDLNDLY